MLSESLNYHQFIQTLENSSNYNNIEKLAQISQLRRKQSNYSIYSQNFNSYTTCSLTSTKLVIPSATNFDSALYQKGFEQRQCDSDKEFDNILECGFHGSVGDCMPTLKLTLTPELLRH